MNKLFGKIKNPQLISSIQRCEEQITPILQNFITNFPDYTDHSIVHSKSVLRYAEHLLSDELDNLNEDEIYILLMGGFLHDIGMCPTPVMKAAILKSQEFKLSENTFENYLRDIHHTISYQYILENWRELHIVNEVYAEAIALTGMGHRVVDLHDFELYNPNYIVKTGEDFVCLPYLACILRVADELDITNDRTPDLLYNRYLPENKISKKEWNKHRSNYFVNFTKPSIKIISKCTDKDLYYALIKQYSKIDQVIKYAHRVINALPFSSRRFVLSYTKLDYDIKPIGFVPKAIGFTFDLQNTIDTFIGENIYRSKFVAIRECVQNAIDSCRFKMQTAGTSYNPRIIVRLFEKQLSITDNGNGMDEFIVQNYFAKLAKSYYNESKVSSRYESIGQFGIGVFSYFLLCESFNVATKALDSEPLKFLVTKDADNYFYFYDHPDLISEGTDVTLNLTEDMDFEELEEQMRYYFRFIEIPIELVYGDFSVNLERENFSVDLMSFLGEQVGRDHHGKIAELVLLHSHVKYLDFEGALSMIFKRNPSGILDTFDIYKELHTTNISRIEISQKGVFLERIDHFHFNTLIGKINLARKNKIDLGRYRVSNQTQIDKPIEIILSDILKQLFENWGTESPKIQCELFRRFLEHSISFHDSMDYQPFYKFFPQMYFRVYVNESLGFQHLALAEVIGLGEVLIMRKDTPFDNANLTDENIKKLYSEDKISIISESAGKSMSFVFNLLRNQTYKIEIVTRAANWYYRIRTNETSDLRHGIEMKRRGEHAAYQFDTNHLCAFTGLYLEVAFNSSHDIVKYYLENKSLIKKTMRTRAAFENFFHETRQFFFGFHQTDSFKLKDVGASFDYLNEALSNVNNTTGTDFRLSSLDFPQWMNEVIKSYQNLSN